MSETAKAQVEAIRERLAFERSQSSLREELSRASWGAFMAMTPSPSYEAIELWARLAADLAGMLSQKERGGA